MIASVVPSRLILPRPLLRFFSRFARPLILVLGFLLLPIEVWHEWLNRQHRFGESQTAASNLAQSLLRATDSEVETTDAELSSVAKLLDASAPAAEVQAQMIRMIAIRPDVVGLEVLDASGRPLLRAGRPTRTDPAEPEPAASGSPQAGGTSLGRIVRIAPDGRWGVTLSQPFQGSGGAPGGSVVATLDMAALTRNFEGLAIGEQGSIALVRSDGHLLARVPAEEHFVGAPVLAGSPIEQEVRRRRSGLFHFTSTIDGVERLGAFQSSEHYPIAVIVGLDSDEALAAWNWHAMLRMLFSVLLASLIIFLGDRLVRSSRYRRRAENCLAESEAEFRVLAENANDMVSRIGPDGRIRYASPAASRLTGLPAQALLGRPFVDIVDPADHPVVQAALTDSREAAGPVAVTSRVLHPDGSSIWMETVIRWVQGSEIDGFVAVSRDVTERQTLAERMAELAATDGLTGIANRRRFDDVLDVEWHRAARQGQSLAVILLDVDRFKIFNDRYGHLAGDQALRSVARALDETIRRSGDVAARYGGEEFAVILPDTDCEGALEVAERIRDAVAAEGILHEANECGLVTASLGVAAMRPLVTAVPDHSMLLGAADAALYEAKRMGRNRVVHAPSITLLPSLTPEIVIVA